jgi:hypothetical protein
MQSDEEKALRLRRTKLQAELARINVLLEDAIPPMPRQHSEIANRRGGYPLNEEDFRKNYNNQPPRVRDLFKGGEYRNTDSNGNYVTPEDNNDSQG